MDTPITEAGEADLGLGLTWAGDHPIMHMDIMPIPDTTLITEPMALIGDITDHITVTIIISMCM